MQHKSYSFSSDYEQTFQYSIMHQLTSLLNIYRDVMVAVSSAQSVVISIHHQTVPDIPGYQDQTCECTRMNIRIISTSLISFHF